MGYLPPTWIVKREHSQGHAGPPMTFPLCQGCIKMPPAGGLICQKDLLA